MITIAIPSYNHGHIITDTILSALGQDYKDKEILVFDDGSQDNSLDVIKKLPVKYMYTKENKGLGYTLTTLARKSNGELIIFLASDDVFTNKHVVSDMVKKAAHVDVVGRYYYQYIDGIPGAVCNVHTNNILQSSCNPSGMLFRKDKLLLPFSNDIFIEVPDMVHRMLQPGGRYKMLKYDTVAVRLHRRKGKHNGNAAILPAYYDRTPRQSMIANWNRLIPGMVWYKGLVQIKNNAPQLLWNEIKYTVKIRPWSLISPTFWFCVAMSMLPIKILRPLCDFYRHRIMRMSATIIRRPE